MKQSIQIYILILIVIVILCLNWKSESFQPVNDTTARRHPDQEMVNGWFNKFRPYNNVNTLLSEKDRTIDFDNSFQDLWKVTPTQPDDKCINYKNINQCMTECSNNSNCIGFYKSGESKCCIMDKTNYQQRTGRITLDDLIKDSRKEENKIIFDKVGNETYMVPLDRKNCKKLCEKCIIGQCPSNYRCSNLTADPRYNYSCIVTNRKGYNENSKILFDDDNIPYLDDLFGLNDYPGYVLANK